jgi:hypothetical protein
VAVSPFFFLSLVFGGVISTFSSITSAFLHACAVSKRAENCLSDGADFFLGERGRLFF